MTDLAGIFEDMPVYADSGLVAGDPAKFSDSLEVSAASMEEIVEVAPDEVHADASALSESYGDYVDMTQRALESSGETLEEVPFPSENETFRRSAEGVGEYKEANCAWESLDETAAS